MWLWNRLPRLTACDIHDFRTSDTEDVDVRLSARLISQVRRDVLEEKGLLINSLPKCIAS